MNKLPSSPNRSFTELQQQGNISFISKIIIIRYVRLLGTMFNMVTQCGNTTNGFWPITSELVLYMPCLLLDDRESIFQFVSQQDHFLSSQAQAGPATGMHKTSEEKNASQFHVSSLKCDQPKCSCFCAFYS